MTAGELAELLAGVDPAAPVRWAHQPSWPLAYDLAEVAEVPDDPTTGGPVVYLVEGRQVGYLPEPAVDLIGWGVAS